MTAIAIYNAIGAVSFLLTIAALFLLGKPDRRAHILFIISCSIQIIIFVGTGQFFLLCQMLVLIAFGFRNYHEWKKKGF